jgi:hypothetical protein
MATTSSDVRSVGYHSVWQLFIFYESSVKYTEVKQTSSFPALLVASTTSEQQLEVVGLPSPGQRRLVNLLLGLRKEATFCPEEAAGAPGCRI